MSVNALRPFPNYPPRAKTGACRAVILRLAMLALVVMAPAFAVDPTVFQNALEPAQTPRARIEQAEIAKQARRYEEAGKLIEEALAMPGFDRLDPEEQYRALWVAAYSALKRHDDLEAHDYLVMATGFDLAGDEPWKFRAQTAQRMEDWADALLALTTVAKRWPAQVGGSSYDDWMVTNVSYHAARDQNLRTQLIEFLNALFEGKYTELYGTQPSDLWLQLVTDALERHDLARARTVSRRITSSATRVQMRIDRRFDALLAAEPALRDVVRSSAAEKKRLAKQVAKHPRSLYLIARYCDALYEVGGFAEILKVTSDAIDRVNEAPTDSPPYEDVAAQIGWIYNHQSVALRALGRNEEGERVLAAWNVDPRNKQGKVNQAINLSAMQNRLGKPEDALQSIDGIDWVKGLSPYGRMQFQRVRLDAYLQLHRKDEADSVLAWLREHQEDAPDTVQSAFLNAGDVDAAAAILIRRLENPVTRTQALASLQNFKSPPNRVRTEPSEFRKRANENYGKMMARSDVKAAIEKYGRVETFPIYDPGL